MQQITVPYLTVQAPGDLPAVSQQLQGLTHHSLGQAPWVTYPYKPFVEFAMAYDAQHIYLHYAVTEKAIRAVNSQVNSRVWQDSCVEFFIGFDEAGYYNLEFNCIGTALAGYGPSKSERNLLPAHIVEQIATRSAIDRRGGGGAISWALLLVIPLAVFIHHQPLKLKGKEARGNFYKCGDALPEPHFISWSPVQTPAPDFHVPASFGVLHFA